MKRWLRIKSIAILGALALFVGCAAPQTTNTEATTAEPATEAAATTEALETTEAPATESEASGSEKTDAKESILETEVVILGTDAAAWTAAVRLTRMGKDTILIGSQPESEFAQSTAPSAILIAGSKIQSEKGVQDSAEALSEDFDSLGIEPESVAARALTEKIGTAIGWLNVSGLALEEAPLMSDPAYSADRLAAMKGGTKDTLLGMREIAREKGASVLWETEKPAILEAGGRVVGIRVQSAEGARIQIYARSVIVTEEGIDVRGMQQPPVTTEAGDWKVDENMAVLNEQGEPIGGLYAAGIVNGRALKNAPGAETTWSFVSGLIAAETVIRDCST